jgi:rubrerythrin
MEDTNLVNGVSSPVIPSDDITNHVPVSKEVLEGKEFENTSPNPEDLESRWLRWKCLNCGFVYEGREPISVCPKCGNSDPDKFDDAF